jgi:hypothetical protein
MQKVRWQAGKFPGRHRRAARRDKGLIISLAVSRRRGDSAANNFRLKM